MITLTCRHIGRASHFPPSLFVVAVEETKKEWLRNHDFVSSSSLCSRSVPWLGEGLSILLPHLPILRYPLPDGALPVVI